MQEELDNLYPCNGCGRWCVPSGMTSYGQALCYRCTELYLAEVPGDDPRYEPPFLCDVIGHKWVWDWDQECEVCEYCWGARD